MARVDGTKTPSRAERARRASLIQRRVRLAIQVMFLIVAPGVFSAAFNGVKYVMGQIGATEPVEATSFLLLLVVTLAFTVVCGRFFCGYACAFGTLGDVVYLAFDFAREKLGIRRVVFPAALVKVLSAMKYVVLVGICAACFLGVWQAVSTLSPWVAFAGFTAGSLGNIEAGAFVLLAAVVAGMAVRERFFCQFLCPMGAVFSLMPQLGFSQFTRTRAHCAPRCGRCNRACPVGIWPDTDALAHGECISCGRCAEACPMGNVNLVAIPRKDKAAPADAADAAAGSQGAQPAAVAAVADAAAGSQGAQPAAVAAVAGAAARSAVPDAADAVDAAVRPDAPGAAAVPGAAAGSQGAQPADAPSTADAVARAEGDAPASSRVADGVPASTGRAAASRPLRKTRDAWRLLRGTETGVVVAKAAVLLVLCWLVQATRYLPPPPT